MDTTYQLTTYSPDYLEKQVEIGKFIFSQWLGARQSPIKRLQQVYSAPDFDPETRFYALKDGEVIGFLPSKIRKDKTEADLEFPLLAAGFEDAEEALMGYAFEQLKSKGVSAVISRVSDAWGNTVALAKKYNYEYNGLMWKNAQLKVENYKGSTDEENVREVTETYFNDIRDLLISFRENTEAEARAQIDKLVEISERVTSWKIIREDGKIVGHDHLVEDIRDSNRARMNAIYATRDDIRDRIMNSHVAAAKRNGISLIDSFFFGPTENMEAPYKDYGFEIGELWSYKKET